jgi:hypothetical protein
MLSAAAARGVDDAPDFFLLLVVALRHIAD